MGQWSLVFVASDHHIVIKSSPRFLACAAERSNSTKFAMTRIDFVDWTFRGSLRLYGCVFRNLTQRTRRKATETTETTETTEIFVLPAAEMFVRHTRC